MKAFLYLTFFMLACSSTHAQKWRLVEYLVQDYDLNDSTKFVTVDSTRYIYDYINGRGGLPGERIQYNVKRNYERANASSPLKLMEESEMFYHSNDDFHYNIRYEKIGAVTQISSIDTYSYSNARLNKYIRYRYHPPTPSVLYGFYKKSYSYDASGNLTANLTSYSGAPGMGWVGTDAFRYKYDANNKLIADSALLVPNLKPHTVHYYSYDNNGRLDKKYNIEPSTEDTSRVTTYFYNASGKLYMDSTYYFPIQGVTHRNRYYYDQNGLLVRVDAYEGQAGNTKKYSKIYHYEIYWPASIVNTTKSQLDVEVFPNPAINTIDIKTVFNHPQKIQLSIMDMQGRVIKRITDRADKQYQRQIYLHDLSSGMYMLHIESEDAESYKQFIVQ